MSGSRSATFPLPAAGLATITGCPNGGPDGSVVTGAVAGELFEEATGRGAALALVLAPAGLRPVRLVRGRGQPEEGDLPDLHARVDRDREVRDVRELERQVAIPAGVDVASGRVDEQSQSAE